MARTPDEDDDDSYVLTPEGPMVMPAIEHGSAAVPEDMRERMQRAAALAARAPVPAQLGRVYAGTAGWTDPTLIKSRLFYPRGTSSAEDRLKFYASQFPMVEVDATYYALPSVQNATRWAERTPPGFTFNIKAFAALTEHPVDLARLPHDMQEALPQPLAARARVYPRDLPGDVQFEIWKRFKHALEPLQKAGKLGCVLFQFPPWFTATKANARTLEVCAARMGSIPLAVEFRHHSWGDPERFPRVMDLLRAHKMAYVCVDEPQNTEHSMPPVTAVADPRLAVVRFHGRRESSWDAVGASVQEKFDYLYDPVELKPWVGKIVKLSQQAQKVHVVFNNCVANYAVVGAKDTMAMLAEQMVPTKSQAEA